jgi:hypothetical protein
MTNDEALDAQFVIRASSFIRNSGLVIRYSLVILVCSLVVLAVSARAGVFYPDGATTLHFAFEGSPNGDRPIVRPPAIYHADDGFGFVDSPGLIGTNSGVTAPKYFRFDVNLPAGTYNVTVRLGGAEAESINNVKAEGKSMVGDIHVNRRQSSVQTFTVTVKHGAPGDTSLELDGRLNLEFEGTNPSMMKLDIAPSEKPAS